MSLSSPLHATATGRGVVVATVAASAAIAGAIAHGPIAQRITELCSARPMFSLAPAEARAGRPATRIETLSCERLPNAPGKTMTTALVHFAPLAHSGAHRHPGSVGAFVVKGTVRSQMAGSPAIAYPAGSTWFEAPRALHLFAENPSTQEEAELLAVFVADEDCGPLVIPEAG